MLFVGFFMMISLVTSSSAFAQASLCGDPPSVANETLKGVIDGKAKSLTGFLGGGPLSHEIEASRQEIFSSFPAAEQGRANAYLEYQLCLILLSDESLSTTEKLHELKKLRSEFSKPVPSDEEIVANVRASRIFAGPNQFPPEQFAAYGILAFRARASSYDHDRHLMICEAYKTSLPHTSELSAPRFHQMVTVWPVDSDIRATELNRMPRLGLCEIAVKQYGLVVAQEALVDAEKAGADVSSRGPFLLAWSPSTAKGKEDVLVLVTDLSRVSTYAEAQNIMQDWTRSIQQDSELWAEGWNLEVLRTNVRLWVDKFGPKVFQVFGER